MYKRVWAGCACLFLLAFGVYVVHFRHPPPNDILAANKAKHRPAGGVKDGNNEYSDEEFPDDPAHQSIWEWNSFIEEMDLVSVGEIYDKCEGNDRLMIGRMVILPDEKNGGVKIRTYVNLTFSEVFTGGEVFFECQYNHQDLYANHWDACTVEGEMIKGEEQLLTCPMPAGKKRFMKEMSIPSYLPKGVYGFKSWLVNQDEKMLVCSFTDFTL